MKGFKEPIYVTRPLLPDWQMFSERLKPIWESKWLSNNGPLVQELEKKLQQFLKVPHCITVNNGTSALMLACRILDLTGEVITTPFTFPATIHALTWNGLIPVFCDIDEKTLTLDPERIESLITAKTTAILGVHVYGQPCHIKAIQTLADKHGLKVIYDAAHGFGMEQQDGAIGNQGDITIFSFHPTKLFHTAEGGALTCSDEHIAQQARLLRNFGIRNEEIVECPGINAKLNEIQALMGLMVMEKIEEERQKRRQLHDAYISCLKGVKGVNVFQASQTTKNSYQYMMLQIDEGEFGLSRDEVYEKLKEYNVFTRKYFYPLCSDYPHYSALPSALPERLSVAHHVAKEVLCMPFYGELMIDDVERICNIVKSFAI